MEIQNFSSSVNLTLIPNVKSFNFSGERYSIHLLKGEEAILFTLLPSIWKFVLLPDRRIVQYFLAFSIIGSEYFDLSNVH